MAKGSDMPCRVPLTHMPDADVAYQPGVDTQGWAVAPADLPQDDALAAPPMDFDLTAPLHAHHPVEEGQRDLSETRLPIGSVTLEGGQATVHVLGSPAEAYPTDPTPCP